MVKKKSDAFGAIHPIVNFMFFTVVIVCAMFFLHPLYMSLMIITGLIYSIYLNGKKAIKFLLIGLLPMFIIASLFNPMFSHSGITILFYHPNGNPITLESVLYGLAMGGMLVNVMIWFSCFNAIMTADKFTYLFGKIVPALSLVFSMTLRMVPRFKLQINKISNAQKCIGKGVNQGNFLQRARNGMSILSILITWALENGVDSAYSMKARGFGLKGRTHFHLFTWKTKDRLLFIFFSLISFSLFIAALRGLTTIQFFPWVIVPEFTLFSYAITILLLMFLLMPMSLNILEDLRWKSIKSKD